MSTLLKQHLCFCPFNLSQSFLSFQLAFLQVTKLKLFKKKCNNYLVFVTLLVVMLALYVFISIFFFFLHFIYLQTSLVCKSIKLCIPNTWQSGQIWLKMMHPFFFFFFCDQVVDTYHEWCSTHKIRSMLFGPVWLIYLNWSFCRDSLLFHYRVSLGCAISMHCTSMTSLNSFTKTL